MSIKNIVNDKYLFPLFTLSLFIFFITSLMFVFFFGRATSPIVIHYDSWRGVIDFIGSRRHVLGVIATGFITLLINMILADFLYLRERFLSYAFGFFSLAFSILILMVLSVIISLN